MAWVITAAFWLWRLLTVKPTSYHSASVYSGSLAWLRSDFIGSLAGISQEARALVAGLTIGDTSQLSAGLKADMKVVSLTHLNAVSGANCAIVVAVVYWLLSKTDLPRVLRLCITLLALAGYAVLVGPQASVLRASAMAALVILTQALGRRVSASRILAIAVLLLLVFYPPLAIDVGFQLSVAATLGILILAPRLAERLSGRIPRWLALSLAVTSAAQIACTPLLLQLQPGFSTYAVLANLICEPMVAPVTILGMIACLFSAFCAPIAVALTWVASLFTFLIAQVAHLFATLPAATLNQVGGPLGLGLVTVATVAVTVWLTANKTRQRSLALAALGVICALELGSCSYSIVQSGRWPLRDWSVISCDVGQGDATLIRSQGKIALIDVGRDPKPIDSCLRHLAITHLDLLLLTHFDLDHVGGLSGALRNRSVEVGMITGYHDPRPAAAITYRELRLAVHHLVTAETNLTGTLGAFSWQVLSPHRDAPEAEDSNDGSVTVLFRSAYVNVLTLADLGERGQMRLAAESSNWLGQGFGAVPMVVKVSHHGSADQYPELYEALRPVVALISVGQYNPYGHPTNRTLTFLQQIGSHIFRTDQDGAISVAVSPSGLRVATAGRL